VLLFSSLQELQFAAFLPPVEGLGGAALYRILLELKNVHSQVSDLLTAEIFVDCCIESRYRRGTHRLPP